MADGQQDNGSGGTEREHYEISRTPEAAAFAALFRVVADSVGIEGLRDTSTARVLSRLITSTPPLPGFEGYAKYIGPDVLRRRVDGTEPPVKIPKGQEGLYFGSVTWTLMRNAILAMGGQKADTQPYVTTDQAETATRKLSRIFKSGSLDLVGKHAQQAQSFYSRNTINKILPVGLIHAAAIGMSARVASEQPESGDARLSTAPADDLLRQACDQIRTGTRPRIDTTDANTTLETGALAALYDAYHLINNSNFLYEAMATIAPLFSRGDDQDDFFAMFAASRELKSSFLRFGFDGRELATSEGVAIVTAKLSEAKKLAATRRAEYTKCIEQLYSKFDMIFFARYLVEAIADGTFLYTEASALADAITTSPLEHRMHIARARREAEAAEAAQRAREQAEEEARLQDLGWLSVQLNLNPLNEVDIEFLPSAMGAGNTQTQAEAADRRTAKERIAKIEEHRLLTLIRLQEIYPGSVLRFRTLKNRRADTGPAPKQRHAINELTPIDPTKVDGYLVLVLPDGRAVGESLQPDNATVVFRPETWHGEITWEDAFAFNKKHVEDVAAVRLQHPDKRDLARDYSGTVDSYVLLILEDLERPLLPGETLPDLGTLRNLRRALGGRAMVVTPS